MAKAKLRRGTPRARKPREPAEPLTEEQAWSRLLDWLTSGPRTERQIAQRMRRWQVEAGASARLVAKLRDLGLVDDAAYAGAYARELERKGHWGRGVEARLRARGVEPETARDATDAACAADEDERATALVAKRIRGARADPKAAPRLVAYLVRRGFSHAAARRAVRTVIGDTADDGDAQ